MGLINILARLFGGSQNPIVDTLGAFRPNAEAEAQRGADYQSAALAQFAAEFYQRKGLFDQLIDALNRLPRPMLAMGTIGLFIYAMADPIGFAARMQGLILVPDPMWWLLGAIVTFYFGARERAKGREFQTSISATMAKVPTVLDNIQRIRELRFDSPGVADTGPDVAVAEVAIKRDHNQAIEDWRGT